MRRAVGCEERPGMLAACMRVLAIPEHTSPMQSPDNLTRICSLLSISWLRPHQANTTKPNMGSVVLTKVLLAHPPPLDASMIAITLQRVC
jgi:hypothetical protein